MDAARLQRALFADLAAKLPQWDLFEDEGAFERVLGTVSWRLRLSLLNNPTGLDVIADVAVEHRQNGECLCTVGAELGAITRSPPRRWRIDERDDVPKVAAALLRQIARTAQPFLSRYSNLPEILRVLRTSPEEARVIRPFVTDYEAEAAAIEARWVAA